MTQKEQEIWNKIQNFEFDAPEIKLTFAKRLARENGFSQNFSEEIVNEYKKFIFLCTVTKSMITPSHYVDLAWHLHLIYTKSYWVDLCQNTIGWQMHHTPTEGGKQQMNKFDNCYSDALDLYKTYFSSPPQNVWQSQQKRFKISTKNIETDKNWVIPKPNLNMSSVRFAGVVIVIFLSLFLYSCESSSSLSNLNYIFIGFAVYLFITLIILTIRKKRRGISFNEGKNRDSSTFLTSDSSFNSSSDSSGNTSDSSNDGFSGGFGGGGFSGGGTGADFTDDTNDSDSDSSDSGDSGGCGGGCGGGGD